MSLMKLAPLIAVLAIACAPEAPDQPERPQATQTVRVAKARLLLVFIKGEATNLYVAGRDSLSGFIRDSASIANLKAVADKRMLTLPPCSILFMEAIGDVTMTRGEAIEASDVTRIYNFSIISPEEVSRMSVPQVQERMHDEDICR